ncbi:hypothetical protein [Streptacidiphilus sp. P02-A3a]|uniref:hypothetical protein n=1 Tax=Streptacidiphilus sp. P02-A3a TaxID=2704468 RepID=UPI0015F93D48|nr:hypothetical protein [Streptacidiphilus sp. P02-A3a]QMU72905.1 hypothetical protein GXP74_36320 [Streptacidiphilus sp. P02-A3a]
MRNPRKRVKIARQLKYGSAELPGPDDFGEDGGGGAGVREPRPDRPRGPGPVASALPEPTAEADPPAYGTAFPLRR